MGDFFPFSKCTTAKGDAYKKEGDPDPADYEKLYFKAEFTSMDKTNRGKLTTSEFVQLMMFLGYGERWKVDVSSYLFKECFVFNSREEVNAG